MSIANAPRVFISYARSDGEAFTTQLRARLEREQPEITLWQDRARMEGGKDWWRQVTDALDQVAFMALVMTPAALASPVVRREWQYARQRGVCVYPVVGSPDLDFGAMPRWMTNAHFYHLDKEWQIFVNYLKSPCIAPRVPFMAPELPDGFVDRPGLLSPLLDALLDAGHDNPAPCRAALFGPGGFGKTTLAAALCHRDEVITAYDAGILWATLGEKPNVLGELTKLFAALTGERPGFVDAQDAARALAERMGDGSYLLVVDDVWNRHDLQPFLQGAPNCARLVTTRQSEIAAGLDARIAVDVDEMSSDEAAAMLTKRLTAPPAEQRPFRQLAARLGEWPLLLELARDVLSKRVEGGEPIEAALAYMNTALDKRGATAFDRRDARARNDAVAKSLLVSLDQLTPDEQTRYRDLAIFPEDVAIPITVTEALWGLDDFDADELVTRLNDISLVRLDRARGAFRLHDVVRVYLAGRLTNTEAAALHARLVDAWGDLHDLPNAYAWRWVGYHLLDANRAERLRQLLFDFTWLRVKLNATDANALVGDFALLENVPAGDETSALANHEVARALRQAAYVLDEDPNQLAIQLWGQLSLEEAPEIRALLEQASAEQHGVWLRPITPSLRGTDAFVHAFPIKYGPLLFGVAVTPDGRRAISASWEKQLRVWNLETGEELPPLIGDSKVVTGVAVTPDGSHAVSALMDKTLAIWNLSMGQALYLVGHEAVISDVAVTLDGSHIISVSSDKTVIIWDMTTFQVQHILKGHRLDDNILRIWDVRNGQDLHTLTLDDYKGDWNRYALTPDNSFAITVSQNGTFRVIDVNAKKELRIIKDPLDLSDEVETPDGRVVKVSIDVNDKTLRVYNHKKGEEPRMDEGFEHPVFSVAVTADGSRAFSVSIDIMEWDAQTGGHVQTFESYPVELLLTPGSRLAVNSVVVTPDGRFVFPSSKDKTIKLWNLQTGMELSTLEGYTDEINGVAVTSDVRLAVSASKDKTLIVWDLREHKKLHTLEGHKGEVTAVAVTHDGNLAISASLDETLTIWDLKDGRKLHSLEGHSGRVDGVALTSDGRLAISISRDKTLRVWDVNSGRALCYLHTNHLLRCCAITADGRTIVAGDDGGRVHFLRLENPEEAIAQ